MPSLGPVIPLASSKTEVLLVQAPYPGLSKFVGRPTSLLSAFSKVSPDILPKLGYVDRQWIDREVADHVRQLCRETPLRVVCVSSSTAAIQEAALIARVVREELGGSVLVVGGGPHEDDCDEKIASRLSDFDVSIGGEAEYAVAALLSEYLTFEWTPETFLRRLDDFDLSAVPHRFSIARRDRLDVSNHSGPAAPLTSFGEIPSIAEAAHFDCFSAPRTIQLMLTRGCPYGQCTFCAEPNNRLQSDRTYDWVADVIATNPGAALYLQDAVMPNTRGVRERLLPLLAESGVEWGCQLYLPMASPSYIETLVRSGCRYLYTGLETAAPDLRRVLGKAPIDVGATIHRLLSGSSLGARWGVSLMFGILDTNGLLRETPRDVRATVDLARQIVDAGVSIEGFFPNIQTILPGTGVDRELRRHGMNLDYYCIPRTQAFSSFEDGEAGYNFLTVSPPVSAHRQMRHVALLNEAAREVQALGMSRWHIGKAGSRSSSRAVVVG